MKKKDVFGIGNALVDTVAFVNDDFLRNHDVSKGTMSLVDEEMQGRLLADLADHELKMTAGGSAANTMHGIALCGGNGYYAGKVASDSFGEFYKDDLENLGIKFEVPPGPKDGTTTGTCLVLTTPDAERSMLTHLGISSSLSNGDINFDDIKNCKALYIEGYMWDGDHQKEACIEAMKVARDNGVLVTFTFSDPFCVNRSKQEFHDICQDYLDVVFCNADEACAFADTKDFDKAVEYVKDKVRGAYITNSEHGSIVVTDGQIKQVAGFPVEPVDTTGAGDAFAAGTLYGLTHDFSPELAARVGNYLGSRIVQKTGARLIPADISKLETIISG